MTNYYIQVAIQEESDIEAARVAAEVAAIANGSAELRVCGTQELVCIVTADGGILTKTK